MKIRMKLTQNTYVGSLWFYYNLKTGSACKYGHAAVFFPASSRGHGENEDIADVYRHEIIRFDV